MKKKKKSTLQFPPVRLVFINKNGEPLPEGHRQRHQATGSKFMMLLFITRKMSMCNGGETRGNLVQSNICLCNLVKYIYIYKKTHQITSLSTEVCWPAASGVQRRTQPALFNPVEDRMRTGAGLKHDTMSV